MNLMNNTIPSVTGKSKSRYSTCTRKTKGDLVTTGQYGSGQEVAIFSISFSRVDQLPIVAGYVGETMLNHHFQGFFQP